MQPNRVDAFKSLCLDVAKTFLLKGGEYTLALTKQHKEEVLAIYQDWFKRSQAVILVEYTGAKMKDMDNIRAKIREIRRRVSRCQEYPCPPRFCRSRPDSAGRLSRKIDGGLVRFQ